ncbi:MAG: DUF4115 domain-containing protein [Thiopseudomonas sp.]
MTDTVKDEQMEQVQMLPGAMLREARLERDLTVAAVAGHLHLTESAVNSLEADRYQDLPGVTFVRGYMRSYAKLVGLDPDQVAASYTQTIKSDPVRALPDLGRTAARSRSRGKLVMAILLAAAVAGLSAAYLWWQEEQGGQLLPSAAAPALNQVEVERVDGSLYIQSLDQLDAETAELEVAEITLDALQAMPDEETPVVEEEQAGPAGEETVAEQADEESEADTGKHRLELAFAEECWIRVTDADGNPLASGLQQAGTRLKLSGDSPFELHLGNASSIQLRFNGKPVDISSSIKGNVARIKLG